jgi:hypothetical protein
VVGRQWALLLLLLVVVVVLVLVVLTAVAVVQAGCVSSGSAYEAAAMQDGCWLGGQLGLAA